MPDRLSLHAPVLINTIGHCAGAIAFGILLYLLVLDWRRATGERSILPGIAAGLALLWNLGSLIGMGTSSDGGPAADVIVAASFSVLSLLPAVLLHISLQSRLRFLWIAGYAVSVLAVALHFADFATAAQRFHYAAILLVTIGFAVLTGISIAWEALRGPAHGGGKRLAAAMVLFLFAISFVHFKSSHDIKGWSGEAALHHAGIPLALFVLLQDYRFLLLDAFVRFLVNGIFAASAVTLTLVTEARLGLMAHARQDPFYAAMAFTAACLLLSLFSYLRVRAQQFLTRAVFLRANADVTTANLRRLAESASGEADYLPAAAQEIAGFFSARRFEIARDEGGNLPAKAAAIVAPLRFSRGDVSLLLLGSRKGGRRYLSEDLEVLERLSAIVCEQVERIRGAEMQALISQAELRALQAQINPHFFFNALNTLYGVIGRENPAARRLVLNLAGLFRHSFATTSGVSSLAEEIKIMRAYLEIEELRLGSKLRVEYDMDDSALDAPVPVLSIQPLVENAVKHGVAKRAGNGYVRLSVQRDAGTILVSVENSGGFHPAGESPSGFGIGMANVRRRLALCCGANSDLEVSSADDMTRVRFRLPVN
jgi:hypothetical protein